MSLFQTSDVVRVKANGDLRIVMARMPQIQEIDGETYEVEYFWTVPIFKDRGEQHLRYDEIVLVERHEWVQRAVDLATQELERGSD